MNKFFDLIKDQFTYGGKKYRYNKTKETTDILFDEFGASWLYGTMSKYCFRYQNLKRERDLLKIACYCYILWLKRGFYFSTEGLETAQNTTVDMKDVNFEMFRKAYASFRNSRVIYSSIEDVYSILATLSDINFNKLKEYHIFHMLLITEHIWEVEYESGEEHDTDTHNE